MPQDRTHTRKGDTIKKFGAVNDPYLSEEGLKKSMCRVCHLVYQKKRWVRNENNPNDQSIQLTLCPACQKIKDHYPEGYLTLKGGEYLDQHKDEIFQIIRNEASRVEMKNPLRRIIDFKKEDDTWLITTTDEKLVQHLAREIHKAHSGKVEYHFGQQNKIARVYWSRDEG